ncbi:hypothetical protein SUGI_0475000 [Cryptomeria japonica]|nr:hypothetical protein SUGI_0475000 [Cryptomeria japonica]
MVERMRMAFVLVNRWRRLVLNWLHPMVWRWCNMEVVHIYDEKDSQTLYCALEEVQTCAHKHEGDEHCGAHGQDYEGIYACDEVVEEVHDGSWVVVACVHTYEGEEHG